MQITTIKRLFLLTPLLASHFIFSAQEQSAITAEQLAAQRREAIASAVVKLLQDRWKNIFLLPAMAPAEPAYQPTDQYIESLEDPGTSIADALSKFHSYLDERIARARGLSSGSLSKGDREKLQKSAEALGKLMAVIGDTISAVNRIAGVPRIEQVSVGAPSEFQSFISRFEEARQVVPVFAEEPGTQHAVLQDAREINASKEDFLRKIETLILSMRELSQANGVLPYKKFLANNPDTAGALEELNALRNKALAASQADETVLQTFGTAMITWADNFFELLDALDQFLFTPRLYAKIEELTHHPEEFTTETAETEQLPAVPAAEVPIQKVAQRAPVPAGKALTAAAPSACGEAERKLLAIADKMFEDVSEALYEVAAVAPSEVESLITVCSELKNHWVYKILKDIEPLLDFLAFEKPLPADFNVEEEIRKQEEENRRLEAQVRALARE